MDKPEKQVSAAISPNLSPTTINMQVDASLTRAELTQTDLDKVVGGGVAGESTDTPHKDW
jgi:hypothetical protein